MLLIGKKMKRRLLGNAYPMDCAQCGNSVYFNLLKVVTRLWFIAPVKSYTSYYLTCPACESVIQLNESASKMGARLVEKTAAYQNDEIDEQEYTDFLVKFDQKMGVERYYEAQMEQALEEMTSEESSTGRREFPEFQ